MSKSVRRPTRGRRIARIATVAGAISLTPSTLLAGSASAAGGFLPGGLVVYRVGSGGSALTSAATAVFLDEYPTTPSASPTFTLPLPAAASAGQDAVTVSGTATSEGELTLSTDGSELLVTGYDAAAGTGSVVSTTSSAVPRVVAEVDSNGDIDTSTTFTTQYSANNIRGAASTNGSFLYASGPSNGIVAIAKGATSGTQVTPTGGDVNFRFANIFAGQLYASSASSNGIGIDSIGTGLPTTPGSPAYVNLPGLDNGASASPYGFLLCNETGGGGPDTAYVADSGVGAVLKYVLDSGTWVAAGSASSTATSGVTGLVGTCPASRTTGTATLYATSPSSLVSIVDTSGQGSLTAAPTLLATAGTNEAFRGVAFAPIVTNSPGLPESPLTFGLPILAALTFGGSALILRRRRSRPASEI
jgi:hypothetical protein